MCILRVYDILANHMILHVYIWYKAFVFYCIFMLFNTLSNNEIKKCIYILYINAAETQEIFQESSLYP